MPVRRRPLGNSTPDSVSSGASRPKPHDAGPSREGPFVILGETLYELSDSTHCAQLHVDGMKRFR
jgi:hypothetical protein